MYTFFFWKKQDPDLPQQRSEANYKPPLGCRALSVLLLFGLGRAAPAACALPWSWHLRSDLLLPSGSWGQNNVNLIRLCHRAGPPTTQCPTSGQRGASEMLGTNLILILMSFCPRHSQRTNFSFPHKAVFPNRQHRDKNGF